MTKGELAPATQEDFDAVFGSMPLAQRAAYEDLWLVFRATFAAEEAERDLSYHPGMRDGTHDRDECPACSSTVREHNRRREVKNRVLDWNRELGVVAGMYESVRTPPLPGAQFYVTTREGHLVAGPYLTHERALRVLPHARQLSHSLDPNSFWIAFGTGAVSPGAEGVFPPGILNEHLTA